MGKKCGNKKKKHGQKTKEIVGKKEREIELNKDKQNTCNGKGKKK